MLLNEFLKEHKNVEEQHRKLEKQEATIAKLKSNLSEQHTQIQALTAGLQKVSAQVGVSVSRAKVVANEQPTRKSTNLNGSSD
jgi:predicted RNase H-like nuclease (RuvC/YqgF family)